MIAMTDIPDHYLPPGWSVVVVENLDDHIVEVYSDGLGNNEVISRYAVDELRREVIFLHGSDIQRSINPFKWCHIANADGFGWKMWGSRGVYIYATKKSDPSVRFSADGSDLLSYSDVTNKILKYEKAVSEEYE